jgi:hypothetical protein
VTANQTSMSGLLGPLPRIGTLHNAVVLVSGPESLLGPPLFGPARAERNAIAEAQKIVAIWNARQAGGRALVLSDDRPPRSQPNCRGFRSLAPRAVNSGRSTCARSIGTGRGDL